MLSTIRVYSEEEIKTGNYCWLFASIVSVVVVVVIALASVDTVSV